MAINILALHHNQSLCRFNPLDVDFISKFLDWLPLKTVPDDKTDLEVLPKLRILFQPYGTDALCCLKISRPFHIEVSPLQEDTWESHVRVPRKSLPLAVVGIVPFCPIFLYIKSNKK